MKIVCATNMPFAQEAFATLGDVVVKDGRTLTQADVRDAAILAIRSTTRVNRDLLEGSSLRFVGTATIGTDHLDIPELEARGISWCYAPGCNADSVGDYIAAALLTLAQRHGITLAGKTLGVVGVGNVGSRVVARAQGLGMRVLQHDPPRARTASGEAAAAFVSRETLLAESDMVTLHVPLQRHGPDATFHLADDAFFVQLRPGAVFLNAARGAVVQTEALKRALATARVGHAVIDTWEGEPAYRHDLLPHVALATPHIAGYSYDGRVNGTVMIYKAACRFLGVAPTWTPVGLLPPPPVPHVQVEAAGRPVEAVLAEVVRCVYDIEADDRRMRRTAVDDAGQRASGFDRLRKTYFERREFPHTRVTVRGGAPELRTRLARLGFAVDPG